MKNLDIKFITNLGILGAVFIGLIFPDTFAFKTVIPFFLAFLIYFSFIKLDFHIKHFLRKELFYYPVLVYIILPFILWIVLGNIEEELLIGLILIAITPTAIASPFVTEMTNGDRELNIIHVLLTNIAAPLSYSALLFILFHAQQIKIPFSFIITKISLIVILPITLGCFLKRVNLIYKSSLKIGKIFSPIAFISVICIAVSSSSGKLYSIETERIFFILLATGSIAFSLYIAGYLLGKNTKTRITLAVSMGHKNTALCVWIAIANFSPLSVLPAICYIIFHHSINAFLIWKFHK